MSTSMGVKLHDVLERLFPLGDASPAPTARAHTMRAFTRLPSAVVTPVVDHLLGDRSSKIQHLGWEIALSLTGAEGARCLERAVTRGPMGMRGAALRRLLQAAPVEQIIDTLVEAARGDDIRLFSVATGALAEVDDPRVTALMLEQFGSPDAAVREQASAWLGRAVRRSPETVRGQMLELLVEGEDLTCRHCVEVLLLSGPPLEVLTAILSAISGLLGWLRTRIIQTLHTFGEELAEAAIVLLRHPDEEVRATALMIAERFRDPRLLGPLCRMLRSEEPIEFVHPVKTALVNQREIGKHSGSYARALRGALREDPDVIMVGELRDQDSIRLALEAAETGHLVLTTMHTSRATQTVERLISGFPPEEQPQVRMALSAAETGLLVLATLHTSSAAKTIDRVINVYPTERQDGVRGVLAAVTRGVVAQQLLLRKSGGRVAAVEVLLSSPALASLIREGKTHQIGGLIAQGRTRGMIGMDESLRRLVEEDEVEPRAALEKALTKDEMRKWLAARGEELPPDDDGQ